MLLLDLKGLDHYFRSANISVPLTALRFSGPASPGTGGDVLMPFEAGIELMAGTLSVPKKSFAALSLKISGGCKGIKIAILL